MSSTSVRGLKYALGVDQRMTTIDHRRLVDETRYALAAEIAENTVTLDRPHGLSRPDPAGARREVR